MKHFIRFDRLLGTAIASLAAALSLTGVAAASLEPPTVPTEIQVGDDHKVFLVGHAVGVQIYTCNATPSGPKWSPAVPKADLYDDRGKLIATHFGGPTWQATDGSRVVGQRLDGVTVDASAIPWLKLSAASTSAGADGARFVATTFIQRVATTGGLMPPAVECDAEHAGTVEAVPYTADYYFWKAKG